MFPQLDMEILDKLLRYQQDPLAEDPFHLMLILDPEPHITLSGQTLTELDGGGVRRTSNELTEALCRGLSSEAHKYME